MKPLLTQTLAWIAAVAIAVLLAMAGPDTADTIRQDAVPHGAVAPR